jgi:hypothetical protein
MTQKTKTILGVVALGAVAYWLYNRNKQGKSLNPFSNFSGDDNFFNLTAAGGGTKTSPRYVAGGYDANHVNPDGTRGATWISYGGSGSSGFWSTSIGLGQYVPQGTVVNPR